MYRLTAVFMLLAILISGTFMAHGLVTGVGIPYPDPTPEQQAYEQYHRPISTSLYHGAAFAWSANAVALLGELIVKLLRKPRPSPQSGERW